MQDITNRISSIKQRIGNQHNTSIPFTSNERRIENHYCSQHTIGTAYDNKYVPKFLRKLVKESNFNFKKSQTSIGCYQATYNVNGYVRFCDGTILTICFEVVKNANVDSVNCQKCEMWLHCGPSSLQIDYVYFGENHLSKNKNKTFINKNALSLLDNLKIDKKPKTLKLYGIFIHNLVHHVRNMCPEQIECSNVEKLVNCCELDSVLVFAKCHKFMYF